MNLLLIGVVLVLVCAYGSNLGLNLPCPSMIKSNKQLLLGVVVGLVLSSQFGFNLNFNLMEGMEAKRNLKQGRGK